MALTKEEEQNWLLDQARSVAQNAYAPYSNFHVGACVLYENGDYFLGCNVENVSYGLSLCAERNALATAITAGEKANIRSITIVSLENKLCMPCGACRQWIFEFAVKNKQNIDIIVEGAEGEPVVYTIHDLLPNAFIM